MYQHSKETDSFHPYLLLILHQNNVVLHILDLILGLWRCGDHNQTLQLQESYECFLLKEGWF